MAQLKEGDVAPAFSGKNQWGDTISLDAFKGKKVILYFYPKDNTPGCTAQACSLRDDYAELRQKGYEVIGVSADSAASHQKFIKKFDEKKAEKAKSQLQKKKHIPTKEFIVL